MLALALPRVFPLSLASRATEETKFDVQSLADSHEEIHGRTRVDKKYLSYNFNIYKKMHIIIFHTIS